MPNASQGKSKGFSLDWLVQGSLTRIGDIFDRMTGRGWRPSSSLATSELIERMKSLMDSEVRQNGDNRKYVPHNIRLKMQWDKFSTDSEKALEALRNEMLIAAVDHINDKHYYTYAPLSIVVKPDYFTSGVQIIAGFDKLEAGDNDAGLHVSIPNSHPGQILPPPEPEKKQRRATFEFVIDGEARSRSIDLTEGKRVSVGRTKENGLALNDNSVSKVHASLLLDGECRLIVADTGSTNGTFLQGQQLPYGKAFVAGTSGSIVFGTVNVKFEIEAAPAEEPAPTQKYEIDGLTFEYRKVEDTAFGNAVENKEGEA